MDEMPHHLGLRCHECDTQRTLSTYRTNSARSLSLSSWPVGSTNHDLARKELKKLMVH
jgi:hypothetical protein